MTTTKPLLAAAVFTMIGAAIVSNSAAAADAGITTMKPVAGVSFDIGPAQAVGFFEPGDGACKLTLMVADAFNGTDVPKASTIRYQLAVAPHARVRFDTAQGTALEFVCQDGAGAMSVRVLERLATLASRH